MSYTLRSSRSRFSNALSGINDKVDRGDEVTLRFQPGAGVNASTGQRVLDALRAGVAETRHFDTPSVVSWGGGTNRGLLVIKAETRSDNYTLQQIANFMPNIARNASISSGLPVTFRSASNEDGDTASASAPSGGSTGKPMPTSDGNILADIIAIRARAAGNRAVADGMNAEIKRRMQTIRAGNYESVIDTVRSLATRAVTESAPVSLVRDTVYYGIRQLNRLALTALQAVDTTLRNTNDPTSFVDTPRNRQIVAECLRGLDLADRIQTALLAIYRVVAPAEGVRGLGDLSTAAYTLALGLLFGPSTGGASVPIALLIALTDLLGLADRVIAAISGLANIAVKPVQEAVSDWLRFVLIGGTVAAAGYIGWNLWITKRAASRLG